MATQNLTKVRMQEGRANFARLIEARRVQDGLSSSVEERLRKSAERLSDEIERAMELRRQRLTTLRGAAVVAIEGGASLASDERKGEVGVGQVPISARLEEERMHRLAEEARSANPAAYDHYQSRVMGSSAALNAAGDAGIAVSGNRQALVTLRNAARGAIERVQDLMEAQRDNMSQWRIDEEQSGRLSWGVT